MLRMPAVFSSSMVLQRNKNIAVWGESDGDFVEVSLNGCTVGTNVHDGRWSLCLPPFKAGGPYSMSVTNGSDVTSFDDIMIGEVWLAGGQSNMELELKDCRDGSRIVQGATDNSTGCNVRFYYTPKVAWMGEELYKAESGSSWEKFTTGNCSRWSAVGYHFASKLSEKLGVTVGIIGCNWGGTSASCWMSREFLGQQLCLSSYLEEYDSIVAKQDEAEYLKEWEEYLIYQAEFDKNVGNSYATSPNPTWDEAIRLFGENKYPGPVGPRNEHRPCGLYETMVSRIAPYTFAGFYACRMDGRAGL